MAYASGWEPGMSDDKAAELVGQTPIFYHGFDTTTLDDMGDGDILKACEIVLLACSAKGRK